MARRIARAIRLNSEKYRKWKEGEGKGFQGSDLTAATIAQTEEANALKALTQSNDYATIKAYRDEALAQMNLAGVAPSWETPEFKDYVKQLVSERESRNNMETADFEAAAKAQATSEPRGFQTPQTSDYAGAAPIAAPAPSTYRSVGLSVVPLPPGVQQIANFTSGGRFGAQTQYGGNISFRPSIPLEEMRTEAMKAQYANEQLLKAARQPYDVKGQPMEVVRTRAEIEQDIRMANAGSTVNTQLALDNQRLAWALADIGKGVIGMASGVMEIPSNTWFGAIRDMIVNFGGAIVTGALEISVALSTHEGQAEELRTEAAALRQRGVDALLNTEHRTGREAAMMQAQARGWIAQADGLDKKAEHVAYWREAARHNFTNFVIGSNSAWQNAVGVFSGKSRFPTPAPLLITGVSTPEQLEKLKKSPSVYYDKASGLFYERKSWDKWKAFLDANHKTQLDNAANAMQEYDLVTQSTDQDEAGAHAQKAIEFLSVSIEARFAAETFNPLESYTWDSEPDKYKGFLSDIARFELQVGREATKEEILKIKDRWVNPITDTAAQLFLDPLNLVPAVWLEELFKPVKALLGPVGEAIAKNKFMQRWFLQESHVSVANRMARGVTDALEMMRGAYQGENITEKLIANMDDIGSIALEIDRRMSEGGIDAARAYYKESRAGIEGLKRMEFDDFLKFTKNFKGTDGAYIISPSDWKAVMQSAQEDAIQAYKNRAFVSYRRKGLSVDDAEALIEKDAIKFQNHVNQTGDAIAELASKVERGFLDPHRAFPKSRLIDDTLLGWLGREAEQAGYHGIAQTLDTWVLVTTTARNLWSGAVLNANPARVIRNLIDSMFRDVTHGGNVIDDLDTLLTNTHLIFADELGFIPVEFGQSLARAGLDFDFSVPFRLTYGDKPKWGVFGYWKQEYDRLGTEDMSKIAMSVSETMHPTAKQMFRNLWNGMRSVPSALADANTAIEFTLRLRMFHREYFNLLRKLEPEILKKAMADLSPEARALAEEAWRISHGNAAKMASYIDSVSLRHDLLNQMKPFIDKAHPAWSYTLPEDFGKGLMEPELFVSHARQQTDAWVESVYAKTGKFPTETAIHDYISESKKALYDSWQASVSSAGAHAGNTGQIGTAVASQPGSIADLGGSAPTVIDHSVPAAPPLRKNNLIPNKKLRPTEVRDNFKEAIAGLADVRPVARSSDVNVIKEGDNIVITIGDNVKPNAMADKLHDATIKAFGMRDEQFILDAARNPTSANRVSWVTKEDWEVKFRQFLTDPVRTLNENQADFVTFVRQMERNPEVYDTLIKTGIKGRKVAEYEQAALVLRNYGYLEQIRDMPKSKYIGLLEREEQIAHPRPISFLRAGDASANATGNWTRELANIMAGDADERVLVTLGSDGINFVNELSNMRMKFADYLRLVEPGPHKAGVSGALEERLWDAYFRIRGAEYESRVSILEPLLKRLQDAKALDVGPVRTKAITNVMKDIKMLKRGGVAQMYLKEQGYTLAFDETGRILNGSLIDDGIERYLSTKEVGALNKFFFEPSAEVYQPLITIDVKGAELSPGKQIKKALVETFGFRDQTAGTITGFLDAQAEWGKAFGRSADEFYESLGFERAVKGWQFRKAGENTDALAKGLIMIDPVSGRRVFIGAGTNDLAEFSRQYTVLLFDDWQKIAMKNPKFADEYFKPIMDLVGIKDVGETVTPAGLNKLADTFTGLIASGKPVDLKIRRPFDAYNKILANAYESIARNQDLVDLSPGMRSALNRMFTTAKMSTPATHSAEDVAKLMAKEMGYEESHVDEILHAMYNRERRAAAFESDPFTRSAFVEWAGERGIPADQAVAKWDKLTKSPEGTWVPLPEDSPMDQMVNEYYNWIDRQTSHPTPKELEQEYISLGYSPDAVTKAMAGYDPSLEGLRMRATQEIVPMPLDVPVYVPDPKSVEIDPLTHNVVYSESTAGSAEKTLHFDKPFQVTDYDYEAELELNYGNDPKAFMSTLRKNGYDGLIIMHNPDQAAETSTVIPLTMGGAELDTRAITKGSGKPGILDFIIDDQWAEGDASKAILHEFENTEPGKWLNRWLSSKGGTTNAVDEAGQAILGEGGKQLTEGAHVKQNLAKALAADPQTKALWEANARKAFDLAYPDQEYVTLTRAYTSSDLNFRPFDSLSENLQGPEGFQRAYITVQVPKENILTSYRDNPIVYKVPGEAEVILNEKGWQGVKVISGDDSGLIQKAIDASLGDTKIYPKKAAVGPTVMRSEEEAAKLFPYRTFEQWKESVDWNNIHSQLRQQAKKSGVEVYIDQQIKEAFPVWKEQFFYGYDDATPEDLMKTLQKNLDMTSDTEARQLIQQQMWQVEDFQQKMMRYHAPKNLEKNIRIRKEFEDWFRGSKVVDDNGEPLALYHGTDRDFAKFDVNAPSRTDDGAYGKAIYLTEQPDVASRYALGEMKTNAPTLQPFKDEVAKMVKRANEESEKRFGKPWADLYLQDPTAAKELENEIVANEFPNLDELAKSLEASRTETNAVGANVRKVYVQAQNPLEIRYGELPPDWLRPEMTPDEKTAAVLAHGYDSIAIRGKDGKILQFVIYDDKNIRSAVGLPAKVAKKDLYGTVLNPEVPFHMVDEGIETAARNNVSNINQIQVMMRELDRLEEHLKTGKGFHGIISDAMRQELQAWKEVGMSAKNNLVSTILNGDGKNVEGAIQKTNRVMLDYSYRTRLDGFMRNIFPFWQFPSRSMPFWVDALTTHPVIVSGYQKYRNLSRQAALQAGAITSAGKPMPSLEGYVPIPGTGMWFNPTAPLSFTYILGSGLSPEDAMYAGTNPEPEVNPTVAMARELADMSQIYGFSMAPWVTWTGKKIFGQSDRSQPAWPIVPQIPLMPRWWVEDLADKVGRMFGYTGYPKFGQGFVNSVYPQANWHDMMVEREMLTKATEEIKTMNNIDALHHMNDVKRAIAQKGNNPMWVDAYRSYTDSEAAKARGSFIYGFFTKDFTDADADVKAALFHLNLMKSAMNNKFQSAMFDLPIDDEQAWNKYLTAQNTPEGWGLKTYTQTGYVRVPETGQIAPTDQRNTYLAMSIMDGEQDALYYQKVTWLQQKYQQELKALGVGAPYSEVAKIQDWYYAELSTLQNTSGWVSGLGTNKPASMIEDGLRDKWFRMVLHTKPRWDDVGGEKYDDYLQRVADWELNLPNTGARFLRYYTAQTDVTDILANLKPDQVLTPGFIQSLADTTNSETLKQWQYSKDTVLDAMNAAYNELYWRPYWDNLKDPTTDSGWKEGSAYKLAADDFLAAHPAPPSSEEMYNYILQTYGDRFTLDQIKFYNDGAPTWDIQKRIDTMHMNDPLYNTRQDVFNLLTYAGPGKGRQVIIDSLSTLDNTAIDDFYATGGHAFDSNPEKLTALRDKISEVINKLKEQGLQEPTRDDQLLFAEAEKQSNEMHEAFTKLINEKFGTKATWDDLSNIISAAAQDAKYFPKDRAEDYNMVVLPYNQFRTDWAKDHEEYAAVYLWTYGPSKYYGRYQNYLANKYRTKAPPKLSILGGVSALKAPPSLAPAGPPAPLEFEMVGKMQMPVGFKDAVSPKLVIEIQQHNFQPDIYHISNAGRSTLEKVATVHVEWSDWIKGILSNP